MRSCRLCGRAAVDRCAARPPPRSPLQALRSSTSSAAAGGGLDEVGVGLVDPGHPGAGVVGRPARLDVPRDQPLHARRLVDDQVPHRVELAAHGLPARLVEQQVVALGHHQLRVGGHLDGVRQRVRPAVVEGRRQHVRPDAHVQPAQQRGVPLGVEGVRRALVLEPSHGDQLGVRAVEAVHRHHRDAVRRGQGRRERRLPGAGGAAQPQHDRPRTAERVGPRRQPICAAVTGV